MAVFAVVPVSVAERKYGRLSAVLIAVAAATAAFVAGGMHPGSSLYFAFVPIALWFSHLSNRDRSVEWIVGGSTLGVALILCVTLLAGAAAMNKTPVEFVNHAADRAVLAVQQMMQEGKDAEQNQQMNDVLDQLITDPEGFKKQLLRAYPGNFFSILLVLFWMAMMVDRWLKLTPEQRLVSAAYGIQPGNRRKLTAWSAPDPLIWVVIALGCMSLIPNEWAKVIGYNGLLFLASVYLLQGVAIMAFWFDAKKVPHFMRTLIYMLVLVFFMFTVVGIGFFDFWFDFRKLKKKPAEAGESGGQK
jgi:uncharacterized protein YybS (DUF2232 family)